MKRNQETKESDPGNPRSYSRATMYEIKIQGQLDLLWSKWFEGMTLEHIENSENGLACTLISGPVIDQPALHGLLIKIRDLNLPLISVRRLNPERKTCEDVPIDSSLDQDIDSG